jgi:hypothetical protein
MYPRLFAAAFVGRSRNNHDCCVTGISREYWVLDGVEERNSIFGSEIVGRSAFSRAAWQPIAGLVLRYEAARAFLAALKAVQRGQGPQPAPAKSEAE